LVLMNLVLDIGILNKKNLKRLIYNYHKLAF
jgi:hypothetical protein